MWWTRSLAVLRDSKSTEPSSIPSETEKQGQGERSRLPRRLWEEFSDKYVGVISSEFLPEIDSYELSMLLSECYRVARPGGLTVHSFLAPIPRNRRQRLLIEADSNPKWTKTPPREWFSPKPDLVMSELRRAGFRNLRVEKIKSNLIIKAEAVRNFLHSWEVRSAFWKSHKVVLVAEGLEVPDWLIVSGRKA